MSEKDTDDVYAWVVSHLYVFFHIVIGLSKDIFRLLITHFNQFVCVNGVDRQVQINSHVRTTFFFLLLCAVFLRSLGCMVYYLKKAKITAFQKT